MAFTDTSRNGSQQDLVLPLLSHVFVYILFAG